MPILYLLLPLSLLIVLAIGVSLCWAVLSGQYDAVDEEGRAIFQDEDDAPMPLAYAEPGAATIAMEAALNRPYPNSPSCPVTSVSKSSSRNGRIASATGCNCLET